VTKQVALSDRAYARLRRSRLKGESFSDTVERLLDSQARDPLRFVERMQEVPMPGTYSERTRRITRERESTRGPA
jgi:predicted CopG family antitoxin